MLIRLLVFNVSFFIAKGGDHFRMTPPLFKINTMNKILLLIALAATSVLLAKVLEPQKNNVANTDNSDSSNSIEFRTYNTSLVAKVKLGTGTYDQLSNRGFRKLANYIFGSNAREEQIAMTSPVMMDLAPSDAKMYFFMPASYSLNSLPNPDNPEVMLEELAPTKMAVIKFGGWASDAKIDRYKERLKQELEEMEIEHTDDFYFMGYNAPFDLVNRRNEVAVKIVQ